MPNMKLTKVFVGSRNVGAVFSKRAPGRRRHYSSKKQKKLGWAGLKPLISLIPAHPRAGKIRTKSRLVRRSV